MVKLEGTLKTRVIHGRSGDFSVGSLLTNIGEFSVKDPKLDLTVDRQLVRQQRDKLRELGYAFDAKR